MDYGGAAERVEAGVEDCLEHCGRYIVVVVVSEVGKVKWDMDRASRRLVEKLRTLREDLK